MNTTTLLRAAYGLLGDGSGKEWQASPEYTRAIVELVADTVGIPDDVDRGGDDLTPFVLGMIYGASA